MGTGGVIDHEWGLVVLFASLHIGMEKNSFFLKNAFQSLLAG